MAKKDENISTKKDIKKTVKPKSDTIKANQKIKANNKNDNDDKNLKQKKNNNLKEIKVVIEKEESKDIKKSNQFSFEKKENWFQNLWKSFRIEVEDRVFMSWKRIIKFTGISLVPIIYGIICTVAFWNPITGIGNAPIAIFNNDHNIVLINSIENDSTNNTSSVKIGALIDDQNGEVMGSNGETIQELLDKVSELKTNDTITINSLNKDGNQQTLQYNEGVTSVTVGSAWEMMKLAFNPKTSDADDTNYTFSTPVIAQGMALKNIHYIKDENTINKEWKNSKYYVQVNISKNYVQNLMGWFGTILASNQIQENVESWKEKMEPLQVWTTFERNFIFGYYMNTFLSFSSGMILQSLPGIIGNGAVAHAADYLSTNGQLINKIIDPDESNKKLFNNSENYTLYRGLDLSYEDEKLVSDSDPNKDEKLKKLSANSVFGNIKSDGTYNNSDPSVADIGGKFLGFINDIVKFGQSGILNILKEIFGSNALTDIIEEIFKLVSDLYTNEKLPILNSAMYKITTNQKLSADSNSNEYESVMRLINLLFRTNLNPNDSDDQNAIDNLWIVDGQKTTDGISKKEEFENGFSTMMLRNDNIFQGASSINELLGIILKAQFNNITGGIQINDIINVDIQGKEHGLYGIGLGGFFLVIGLWVGVLMQTFVFDRAKRYAKSTKSTWYLSKTLLMLATMFIQVTAEIWLAYAIGWHQIGAEAMVYLWLWFLASGTMFVILIQGLWFSVKDEAVGKFLVVIVMVLSLSAGGGTFPSLSQYGFFRAVGYVVPFTYVLKGIYAIVFGVSLLGTHASTTAVILKSFATFFAYIAIFGALGLFIGAKNRFKEMDYGSHYAKCVAGAMKALNRDTSKFELIIKKPGKKDKIKYDWKALPKGYDQELYLKAREMYPFEGGFKWWAKKHHDPVQKPNLSDEDIISRNE